MKNVIVTGANGFIGSSLVNRLIKKGVKVVAIDISFERTLIHDSDNVLKIESSLDDLDYLKEHIPSVEYDLMYHLAWAGVNGQNKSDPAIQLNNIQLSINCVNLCKDIGVRKIFCAGTVAEQSVHSLPNLTQTSNGMMYGIAKHCAHLFVEDYCKNIGMSFVWMQFSNIYGVGNRTGNLVNYTLCELMKGNNAYFGPATRPYDFIYIDDLLEAIYRLGCIDTDNNFFYIGSGLPRILMEYLFKIGDLVGARNKICLGVRPDDAINYDFSMFDSDPLKSAIGEYATTSFEDGVLKTIGWLKNCNDNSI